MEPTAMEYECNGQIRVYYADAPLTDLDDLYSRYMRRPWSAIFRASEPEE